MHETGKSMIRRSCDSRFATRYIKGAAIDIGSGDDSLVLYAYMFPLLTSVRSWDVDDGDAMRMDGVRSNQYDCVHASHCLEHLVDPETALQNWIRICKSGGHLVIVVPDFEQYEQGLWPSRFNPDHKWAFSISGVKQHNRHIVLLNYLHYFLMLKVLKIELVERAYDYAASTRDQSLSIACEPAIEIIAQKR